MQTKSNRTTRGREPFTVDQPPAANDAFAGMVDALTTHATAGKRKRGRPRTNGAKTGLVLFRSLHMLCAFEDAHRSGSGYKEALGAAVSAGNTCPTRPIW